VAGEIIRKADPTSHGGTVLEGSLADICHGKPIAFIGHKVHCPKCKGVFPIYVDLNLHVETENYAPGDTVLIIVKNDDESELVSGNRSFEVQGVIGADGRATLINVFQDKTVEIGVVG
jgi:hypothetical protein